MPDRTELDETQDERDVADETGATPDEAHRIGEFDDLRDMMASIRDELSGLRSTIADMMTSNPGDSVPSTNDDSNDGNLIEIDDLDL